MNRKVLVVCAHPDDEALGAAGTLARHSAEGDEVHILFVSEGVTARDAKCDIPARAKEIGERKQMAEKAAGAIHAQRPRFLDFPDNRMDQIDLLDIVKLIEVTIVEIAPDVIYTNHANDLNVDHRITHQAVLTACRPLPGASVKAIYAFETASSTEWESVGLGGPFQPTRFVDIAPYWEIKCAAIAAYEREMRPFPHPRSAEAIEAKARWRGAQVGLIAAEAFVIVREIL